jgi:DivIVA domain-containing protein
MVGIGHTQVVLHNDASKADDRDTHSTAQESEQSFGDMRHYVPPDILDVSFPASVRGYDRRAVDAYVKRVNRVIAELKVSASPPAAVRHALDQAGQKVEGLLQAAREAAEEITTSARQESEENTARAKAEAADLILNTSTEADRLKAEADQIIAAAKAEAATTVANAKADATEIVSQAEAEAQNVQARAQAEGDERLRQLQDELASERNKAEIRMRAVQDDTEAVWKQRRELLDDMNTLASGLLDLAKAAAARVPAEPQWETLKADAADETESGRIAGNESTPTPPAQGSREAGPESVPPPDLPN